MESGSVSPPTTRPVPRNTLSRSAFKIKKSSECCSWKGTALCAMKVSVLLAMLLCYCIVKLGGFAQENNTIDSGELDIGQRAIQEVPPGIFWRSQLFIDQPQFLRFNISLQKDALIGVYGQKGLPPSHTQYDFVELLDGSRLIARQQCSLLESERASQQTRSISLHEAGFIQYLDSGIWHLAFYNDGENAEQVSFNTIAIAAYPVLCSGNGQYSKGRCLCFSGWKGAECDVPATQCIDLQCGGCGICVMGSCACNSGYKGENCEEADCLDPACSNNGVCIHGECRCNPGWCGNNCEILKTMSPDQCSGHGTYLQESGTCICDPNWTGVDCLDEICAVDCGSHGVCMGGTCHCQKGWTGPACNQRAYHPRCAEHTTCKDGSCECSQGRNGKHSGVLANPVVEPHVRAVWGKNVTLKCTIEISGTITQISWEKMHGKSKQTIAVHHPKYGFAAQGEYQGRVSLKSNSLTDATITLHNISLSDSGEYVCKAVTFPLGNVESSTTVTVLVRCSGHLSSQNIGQLDIPCECLAAFEPIVSVTKGPNSLIDGENKKIAAICTAATGKPGADIEWEGGLGEVESISTLFPNETVTVVAWYKLIPTKFATGRRITCVVRHPALEKELRYPYTLDILYAPEVSITGYDGNWFLGRERVQLRCNANANPPPTDFTWTRLDGQWPEGLMSSNNTLHFNRPLTYNYGGTYVCKVTNSLGQRSDQKTIYILYPPTATTRRPMLPWRPSTDGIRALATEPDLMHFPTSTLSSFIAGNQSTIVASAVCGALFLILVSVLVGVICYRRRWTVCAFYFARNYIPPSNMQKESQIDVLHSDDVDSHPDSIKKETVNSPTSKDLEGHLKDNPERNNLVSTNRSQERYERPMEHGTLGRKDLGGQCYNDNEDDNPQRNNLVNTNRSQERYERPMEHRTLGRKDMGGQCYNDNEDDNPQRNNLVNTNRSQERYERPMEHRTLGRKDMGGQRYNDNEDDNPQRNNLVNTNRSQERYERPMEHRTLGRKDMGGQRYNDNEDDNPQWNNLVSFKRFKELYERPMDDYEGGTLGRGYMGGECYDDNGEDFILHVDGSIEFRRERYV